MFLGVSLAYSVFPGVSHQDYSKFRVDLRTSRRLSLTAAYSIGYFGRGGATGLGQATWRSELGKHLYSRGLVESSFIASEHDGQRLERHCARTHPESHGYRRRSPRVDTAANIAGSSRLLRTLIAAKKETVQIALVAERAEIDSTHRERLHANTVPNSRPNCRKPWPKELRRRSGYCGEQTEHCRVEADDVL